MVIDQRNAGANTVPTSSGTYTLDRWSAVMFTGTSKYSVQQSSTAPAGFNTSLLVTSTTANTVGSGDYYLIQQSIEGNNIADLGWGTANAKAVTLSFWVRSSGLTYPATFGGTIVNHNYSRCYPFTYTINSANTFEQKTITIQGDTSGTWQSNTAAGMLVNFSLGSGSTVSGTAGAWSGTLYTSATGTTQLVATNGATLYLTGVQLEVGSQATSFDYRPYGTELALCQRYYWQCTDSIGQSTSVNNITRTPVSMPVPMRAAPTLTSGASFTVGSGSAGTPLLFIGTGSPATVTAVWIYNSSSNWTIGQAIQLNAGFTAEL